MALRALDLFCGAGGVSMGLHQAGFEAWGVDIKRQPRYPFPHRFVQGDALRPPFDLADFDFVWASPPCQAHSIARNMKHQREHPDLVPATRALLEGHPLTCIENVPGAPLRIDLRLDGWMFPDLRVIRERWFETSFFCFSPQVTRPRGLLGKGYISVIGSGTPPYMVRRGIRYGVADCRRAMGIPWMSRKELSQAIPPAYAAFIGRAAIAWRRAGEAA